ncbi:hypothetical protein [Nonomuraea helvata]|uniref:MFS transporter n=1 Tax=Nonomuraea helvata TaxID=37484 RepID=A0ABV5S584_9ACTN
MKTGQVDSGRRSRRARHGRSASFRLALVTALAPAHVLGRALARFQLSTGFGLAVSPAVITALASHGSAALWGSLAGATLLSASAVATEKDQETRLSDCRRHARAGS